MQQTLPTYREPRVAPSNPHYENPRYVAPIPRVDSSARPHYAGYPQRDAVDIGPTSNWTKFHCSADRGAIERAKVTTVIVPSEHFDRSSPLTDVEVTGKRARGQLNGSVVKFREESGDWKFCMTA